MALYGKGRTQADLLATGYYTPAQAASMAKPTAKQVTRTIA
jgi:hypothetical protein